MDFEYWNQINVNVKMFIMIMEVKCVLDVKIIVRPVHQILHVTPVYRQEYWSVDNVYVNLDSMMMEHQYANVL